MDTSGIPTKYDAILGQALGMTAEEYRVWIREIIPSGTSVQRIDVPTLTSASGTSVYVDMSREPGRIVVEGFKYIKYLPTYADIIKINDISEFEIKNSYLLFYRVS